MLREATVTLTLVVQTGQIGPPIMLAHHCSALAATKCALLPTASPVISAACYPWKVLCRRLFVPTDPLVSAICIPCFLVCHSGRFLFIVFCLYPERKVPSRMLFSKFKVSRNFATALESQLFIITVIQCYEDSIHKMAQQFGVPVTKADDLSLNPRTDEIERED